MKKLFFFLCTLWVAGSLSAKPYIRIDKNRMTIFVLEEKTSDTLHEATLCDTLLAAPISCGRNLGPKQRTGDLRTPEGQFRIISIEDSHGWGHDFRDGNGFIPNAYGPWFIRLSCGRDIGIHGTHDPASMGLRATEGCIRLRNEDLKRLHSLVKVGMQVIITPDTFTTLSHYPDPMPLPAVSVLLPAEITVPTLTYDATPRRRHRR